MYGCKTNMFSFLLWILSLASDAWLQTANRAQSEDHAQVNWQMPQARWQGEEGTRGGTQGLDRITELLNYQSWDLLTLRPLGKGKNKCPCCFCSGCLEIDGLFLFYKIKAQRI